MKLKEGSVGDPDIYLGAKLRKIQMDTDVWCWWIIPSKYVQEAIRNCENYLNARTARRSINSLTKIDLHSIHNKAGSKEVITILILSSTNLKLKPYSTHSFEQ